MTAALIDTIEITHTLPCLADAGYDVPNAFRPSDDAR